MDQGDGGTRRVVRPRSAHDTFQSGVDDATQTGEAAEEGAQRLSFGRRPLDEDKGPMVATSARGPPPPTAPRSSEIKGGSVPEVEQGGVLGRVFQCAVCGSDLHFYRGEVPLPP